MYEISDWIEPLKDENGELCKSKLKKLGASEDDLSYVFDEKGNLMSIFKLDQLWGLPVRDFSKQILALLEPHHRLQQIPLNTIFETGFNDHGPTHIERVTKQTMACLEAAIASDEDIRIGILACACHDIGNMIDRKTHHIWSARILNQIISFGKYKKIFEETKKAIFFHEEKSHLESDNTETLSKSALALIMADKTDVSYLRVHPVSDQKAALKDMHVIVNFMVDSTELGFRQTKTVWKLIFTPNAARVSGLFSELLKHGERKFVPEEWQRIYREENVEYLFMFYAKILSLYLDRIKLAIDANFALLPTIDRFQFVVQDPERRIEIRREFLRDTASLQIDQLKRNLNKNSHNE